MLDKLWIQRAREFAMEKHEGLIRPNKAREPIWTHLEEVAILVEQSGGSTEEIMAAWLHDTREDTATTHDELENKFGPVVAQLVDGLTDKPDIVNLPILERKLIQAERIRHKDQRVKRAKKADQTSNVRLVTQDPPVDWSRGECVDYIRGAAAIAQECNGISSLLDMQFDCAIIAAREKYPELRWHLPEPK